MSGEYCTPLIPRPKGVTAEDFARILAPETRTSYYPTKNLAGIKITPDTTTHCAGLGKDGVCPTVQILRTLQDMGRLPEGDRIFDYFNGCLFNSNTAD